MESTNDHQVPPQPPPRFTSQQSKTIPLTPVIDNKDFDSNVKPIRPEIWFRIAYISVSSAIFGKSSLSSLIKLFFSYRPNNFFSSLIF